MMSAAIRPAHGSTGTMKAIAADIMGKQRADQRATLNGLVYQRREQGKGRREGDAKREPSFQPVRLRCVLERGSRPSMS
jgi:hypothetical protein